MALGEQKMRTIWVLLVLCLFACTAQSQNKCNRLERCDACIQTAGCMWCSNPKKSSDDDETVYNCQPNTVNVSSFCDPENLEDPKNEQEITLNEPLTTIEEGQTSRPEDEKIVQLYPQGMRLKLRRGTPETIQVTYRQAQDYPVDLYYLMDVSNTMSDDKAQLASLGKKLTDTLKNLTSKFTIGFGSFVDKVMMPYAEMSPEKLKSPCDNCTTPYCFRNNLPLGSDAEMFTRRVKETNISGNQDQPEGGFDALMQAMVCKEQIGWRNQSRRIIIYSTDDKFHFAGDGRLAGIAAPNDEKCHLNEDGEYADFDKYDYPSIGQIDKISKRENINIIFAVSKYEELYKEVSEIIKTSSYGLMNEDSSNVVELVVKQYKEISSQVQLADNSTNSPVSIRYKSSCKEGPLKETQECSGITQGTEVTFDLEVEAKECIKDQDKVIVEVKTLQDSLFLEIEIDCNCNCETEGRIANSTECKNQGSLVCGVCECFPNFQGKNCMCTISDASDGRPEDEQLCKGPNGRICSGQGYCNCGACACRGSEITGKYCECNSLKCVSGEKEICSGHGTCECDTCSCEEGYYGQFCECKPDSFCVKPGSPTNEICSGQGTCECGECTCNSTYRGKYCDDCLTCRSGKCTEFKECVQCQFSKPPCKCSNNNIDITPVDSLERYTDKGAQKCTFEDENGCYFRFTYQYNDHSRDSDVNYFIHVLEQMECPQKAPIMGIVFGLVAAIVAIGLLTLIIWKVVTTIHDRKEYARFEDEAKQGAWSNDNRMYVPPIQTVENPMFAQNT